MTTPSKNQAELLEENTELRARLEEAEETLRAIRSGESDSLALRASEERFRQLADAMPQLVWTANSDGIPDYYNARSVEYGVAVTSLTTDDWTPALHPDDVAPTLEAWREALARGLTYQKEQRLRAADGSYRWHLARAIPQRGQNGVIVKWFGTTTDIHDLKQTALALRESEQRLRLAHVAANAGAWEWDLATHQNIWSDEIWRLYGLAPHSCEPSYEAWLQTIHPDDRAAAAQAVQEAARDGKELTAEWRVHQTGGADRWLMSRGQPLRDAAGAVTRYIGVVLDITSRRQAEAALRRRAEEALHISEQEFRSLAEAVPQIVWATRPDGWNIYFNQQWVDYTGMTMEESYGHGWNTPFHPDDKQRAWDAWQRATQHNERYSLECRLRRHDGVYRWWLVRGEPMRGANGEILKWFGTCTDIEDIKRAEAALREANDSLEQRVAERTAALQASEHRFRLALQNAPVSVAMQDRNLVYQWAYNQRTRRPDEIVGRTDADLFAPEDVPGILEVKRRVLESGTEAHVQHWLTSNGKRLFLDLYYEPTRDAAGEITGIGIAVVDLTRQKLAEDALRESEERFKAIASSTPDHILVQDRDLRYLFVVNPQLGLTERDMIGKTDHDFLSREDADRLTRIKRRVLETGEPGHIEAPLMSASGQRAFFSGSYVPRRTTGGQIDGLIGYFQNVTERKRSEEALQKSQRLLQDVIDGSPSPIFLKDSEGKFLTINTSLEKLLCLAREALIGKTDYDIAPQEVADDWRSHDKQVMETGKAIQIEEVADLPDGHHIFLASKFPLANANGQIYGVGAISHDITERKRIEEALRASNQELNRFNQAMIGRELRMVELKREINALCAQLGRPPRYHQAE